MSVCSHCTNTVWAHIIASVWTHGLSVNCTKHNTAHRTTFTQWRHAQFEFALVVSPPHPSRRQKLQSVTWALCDNVRWFFVQLCTLCCTGLCVLCSRVHINCSILSVSPTHLLLEVRWGTYLPISLIYLVSSQGISAKNLFSGIF